jgi:hypothetical protein
VCGIFFFIEIYSLRNQGEPARILELGGVYSGMWTEGKMHGGGVIRCTGGGSYRGEFREGHMHGRGVLTFPSGTRYTGHLAHSKFSGTGRLQFPDGTELTGVFSDGQLHGPGRRTFPDGGVYLGEFLNDMEHGPGVYTAPESDAPAVPPAAGAAAAGHAQGSDEAHKPDGPAECAKIVGLWEHGRVVKMMVPQHAEDGGQFYAGLVDAEPAHLYKLLGRPQPELLPHETTSKDARDTLEHHCFPAVTHPGTGGVRVSARGAVAIWATGDRYLGALTHGKKHGPGVYLYPHTPPLAGTWARDTLTGVRHPPLRGAGVGDRVRGMWARNAATGVALRSAVERWDSHKDRRRNEALAAAQEARPAARSRTSSSMSGAGGRR